MEKWKAIYGYEGFYEVSDLGRIRRIAPARGTRPGHVLTPSEMPKRRYRIVFLSKTPTDHKAFRVCRLVAKTFIGFPPSDAYQINHKNGVRNDDRACNLEWVTAKENVRHRFDVLKQRNNYGESHQKAIFKDEQIAIIKAMWREGASNGSIAKQFNSKLATIKMITSNRNWPHIHAAKTIPKQFVVGQLEKPKGSKHKRSVLTESIVKTIRASNKRGVDLASQYGVTPALISAIRTRKIWRHI